MRRDLGLLLPAFGVAASVAVLVGAVSVHFSGGNSAQLFGLGVLGWVAAMGSGVFLNRA